MKNTKINQMKQSKTPYVPDPQSTMDKNLLLGMFKHNYRFFVNSQLKHSL